MLQDRCHRWLAVLLAVCLAACAGSGTPSGSGTQAVWADLYATLLAKHKDPVFLHLLDGKTYYYFRGPCCDGANHLYDEKGAYVCDPNGGFAGQGDRSCPRLRAALASSQGKLVPNPFYRN